MDSSTFNEEKEGKAACRNDIVTLSDSLSDISMGITIDVVHVDVRLKGEMRGMTVVDDQLFIVQSEDLAVKVYDSYNLTEQSRINIPDMKDPQGLAGCSHNKALYISDSKLKCIHRVNLTDNSVKRWRLREHYEPRGLSITPHSQLLITALIRNNKVETVKKSPSKNNESRLVEYTSEGQLIRIVELDKSVEEAWQTVQLFSDQFIICHGRWASSLHRLCVINSRGEIVKSFGKERGEDKIQLNTPQSITVDRNTNIFVADSGNERIVMFSGNLSLLGQIQINDDLSLPSTIFFDSNSDRLFINSTKSMLLSGLTIIDLNIFLVYAETSYILIYDQYTLVQQPRINVRNMQDPRGIAGCPHHKALYISDWEIKCIHRVNLRNNTTKRWKLIVNYRPCGLSVTSEHNVLVTEWINDINGESRVVEYSSEGQLIRTIEFDREIKWAWQTLQMSNDRFVIGQGRGPSLLRLAVINVQGQILKRYGKVRERGNSQLYWLRSLAMDNSRNHVFVADSYRDKVVVSNEDLTIFGQVQIRDDLSLPSQLYFDSNSDRLFVGEYRTGRVLIINSPDRWIKYI